MTTALLIVDMQSDFFVHDELFKRRSKLIASTNDLISRARRASVSVIWVKQEFSPDLSDASLEVKQRKSTWSLRAQRERKFFLSWICKTMTKSL
ncbi:isochorismatase family protein [Luteibacter sp.]|uniref:isochorismatase family protein n=1 Tax=Luteibacter sp. TaxID=1886636 RepID=UPI0025C379BE|nr:isochorismatase family protein [Luteibacter sp.]